MTGITHARLLELLEYDKSTGIFTSKVNRGRIKVGGPVGTLHITGYEHIGLDGKIYKSHRLAWLYVTGFMPSGDIDHVDGIKNNNKWCNLRDVDKNTNQQNRIKAQQNSSTGMLGVTRHKNVFVASITIENKRVYIGSFNTPEAAHAAYIEQKRLIHNGCTI